jgi:UDP-glucose 4-epimerase
MSFLDQVEEIYNNILGRITRGKSMYLFEKRYNKEVGPYLRDLILDTNKVHLSIINLAPKESKAYEEIMNFGKDVGFIASEMVTKTRKIRRLGRAKTEVIKEKFRLIVKELRDKGKVQLREMNGIINKYERKEKIPENKSE